MRIAAARPAAPCAATLLDGRGDVMAVADTGWGMLFARNARRGSRARRPHFEYMGCMDWRAFVSTFAAIFLAEIGDKTQLATLSLAAGGSSRWTVFAGAALALVATSAIAVLAGEGLGRAIPPIWLRRAAGVVFVVLGVLFLVGRGDGGS